jgi:hypothetical protein
MRPAEVLKLLRRAPFEPFAIFLSDGSRYEVRHPDQVILTPRAIYVGIAGNGRSTVAQDVVICDLVHVTRLVPARRPRSRRRLQ